MSIDHHFHVPAGMRNNRNWKFSDRKYWSLGEMGDKHGCPNHQLFLAHSYCTDDDGSTHGILIDEQFYFEDSEDARWFYGEGYRRMLYEGEERPDRMTLWIDGQEITEDGQQEENNEQRV